ncbi:MAG TPA: threonine--tRNA ligase [Candidatus Nanoarchaeia archaeon]|nr:threonine--tRNA ligase [Candidatus Nanoarchaeia archaeon]
MDKNQKEYLDNLRHTCAHLLAKAVKDLWPGTHNAIGPSIEDGFYQDFDFGTAKISEEDFPKIEKRMRQIVQNWKDFKFGEVTIAEAKKLFKDNPYKLELIEEFAKDGKKLSTNNPGDFLDLCKMGHIENPSKELQHFKLLKVAGAYWRGNEKNKMLTRIYGTAFARKEELEQHLKMLEEAKKRDHKILGEQLDLFMISDKIGKGLPLWLPKGEIIKKEIENFAIETEKKYGYIRVSTPHIAKEELFITSGHLPHYKESMYPPMKMDDGTYYLKAMNCPLHHIIYKRGMRSYRELPLRIAEYGTVYRNELSGTLAGLLRVRMLTMNDAHIYCTKEQIGEEIESVIKMIKEYYKVFGFENYYMRLSLWDSTNKEKYIDEPKNWEYAEGELRKILKKLKVEFVEAKNEAAFYGPKIDIQFKTVTGREETMSTVQLDFAAKKRFELEYSDKEGKQNNEVFVIHRAPLSTHERFVAFLIEHHAGKFPVWLAPTQVSIITVADRHIDYAKKLKQSLEENNVRTELDDRAESIGKKVRDHQQMKVPYIITIGDKEIESNILAIRTRDNKVQNLKKEEFIKQISKEIKEKL